MELFQIPHQMVQNLEGLQFFSNFDSGNLHRAVKVGMNQFELYIGSDASNKGFTHYRVWFYFGMRGMKKGNYRFTIMNASNCKLFSSNIFKPVFKALPSQPEWQRLVLPTICTQSSCSNLRYSWSFDYVGTDTEVFFALAPPFTYEDLLTSLRNYESLATPDIYFYREVLARSLDNREIDLLTISHRKNFLSEREDRKVGMFPSNSPRCLKANKPIIFISARVHPGETPASFMMNSLIQLLLTKDPRGVSLRNNFVFKIVPMLNPDGVVRGHFRVDQNGINLNRCYAFPSLLDQPCIFAVKEYVETVIFSNICFYLDLHAHASKKSCFVFGNSLEGVRAQDIEVFGKLLELNSQFFDYQDSDFSEKSMNAKDPKDHHSKEGSGRVAFYKSIDLTHSYTIESSYYIPKPLHLIPPMVSSKTGKRTAEFPINEHNTVLVYNKQMFVDISVGILSAILDIFKLNSFSRLPATEYKNIENLKEVINNYRKLKKIKVRKSQSRSEMQKLQEKGGLDKKNKLPVIIPSDRSSEVRQGYRQKTNIKYTLRPKTMI